MLVARYPHANVAAHLLRARNGIHQVRHKRGQAFPCSVVVYLSNSPQAEKIAGVFRRLDHFEVLVHLHVDGTGALGFAGRLLLEVFLNLINRKSPQQSAEQGTVMRLCGCRNPERDSYIEIFAAASSCWSWVYRPAACSRPAALQRSIGFHKRRATALKASLKLTCEESPTARLRILSL
jgi:hypothetical protein